MASGSLTGFSDAEKVRPAGVVRLAERANDHARSRDGHRGSERISSDGVIAL